VCLLNDSQAAAALPHLERLRRRQPDNRVAQVEMARCQDLLGRQAEAEALLDEVLAADPHDAQALALRGALAARAGRLDVAEDWLKQASALAPGDSQVHYQLALCLRSRGKAKEAQEVQARLREIQADSERLRDILLKDLPQAPHDPALHYELAMIALRQGAERDAVRWLNSALKDDPQYAPAHRALAGYYRHIGQQGRASRHLELAGAAAPDAPPLESHKAPGS
jgi:Tfp pilus assembly protein PilF